MLLNYDKSLDCESELREHGKPGEGLMELDLVLQVAAAIGPLIAAACQVLLHRRKARSEERDAALQRYGTACREAWEFMRQHPDRHFPHGWRGGE